MKKVTLILLSFITFSCSTNKKRFELTNGLYISHVTVLTTESGDYQPFQSHVVAEGEKIIYAGQEVPIVTGNFKKIDGKISF
jgi:hypothetical protein